MVFIHINHDVYKKSVFIDIYLFIYLFMVYKFACIYIQSLQNRQNVNRGLQLEVS